MPFSSAGASGWPTSSSAGRSSRSRPSAASPTRRSSPPSARREAARAAGAAQRASAPMPRKRLGREPRPKGKRLRLRANREPEDMGALLEEEPLEANAPDSSDGACPGRAGNHGRALDRRGPGPAPRPPPAQAYRLRHAPRGRLPPRLHDQRALLRHRHLLHHRLRRRPRRPRSRPRPHHRRSRTRATPRTRSASGASCVMPRAWASPSRKKTAEAIARHRNRLDTCSGARIFEELNKDMKSGSVRAFFQAARTHGILPRVLGNVGEIYQASDNAFERLTFLLGAIDASINSGGAPPPKWPTASSSGPGPSPSSPPCTATNPRSSTTPSGGVRQPQSPRPCLETVHTLVIVDHMLHALTDGKMHWALKESPTTPRPPASPRSSLTARSAPAMIRSLIYRNRRFGPTPGPGPHPAPPQKPSFLPPRPKSPFRLPAKTPVLSLLGAKMKLSY